MIKNVKDWTGYRHMRRDYFFAQFLTGHGSFESYRVKIRKAENSNCENNYSPKHNLQLLKMGERKDMPRTGNQYIIYYSR